MDSGQKIGRLTFANLAIHTRSQGAVKPANGSNSDHESDAFLAFEENHRNDSGVDGANVDGLSIDQESVRSDARYSLGSVSPVLPNPVQITYLGGYQASDAGYTLNDK